MVPFSSTSIFTPASDCEIISYPKGDNGFGYDPIFMIGDKSFAEISSEEKNKISHRANALKKLTEKLKGEKYDNNKTES